MEEEYNNILENINIMETLLKKISKDVKNAKKKSRKLNQEYSKLQKQTSKKTSRPRSGIHKPCVVSDELCAFMHLPKGSYVARTDATVAVNKYIRTMRLQNTENKREFRLNEDLKNLFQIEDRETITYFEIPKLMNKHFQNHKNVQSIQNQL